MSSIRIVVLRVPRTPVPLADAHDVDVGAVEGSGRRRIAALGDVGAEGVVDGVEGAVDGEDGAAIAGADGAGVARRVPPTPPVAELAVKVSLTSVTTPPLLKMPPPEAGAAAAAAAQNVCADPPAPPSPPGAVPPGPPEPPPPPPPPPPNPPGHPPSRS